MTGDEPRDSLGLLRSFISPESVRLFGIASSGLSASSTEVTFQKVLERDADEEVTETNIPKNRGEVTLPMTSVQRVFFCFVAEVTYEAGSEGRM